jgi:leucyl/phenylalanyl-tRNA---protein transferase
MTRRLSLYQQLEPELVLRAYAMGVFPMADHRDAPGVYWVEPRVRGVLPLDGFHLSRSLRKTIVRDRFHVTINRAFDAVIGLCAESAADRPETWINPPIAIAFARLNQMGYAHSVECWDHGRLVGGLYGLALGRAFFGESMFSRATDASKVALAWLVARLKVGGFTLLDCQFQTDHLQSLGAIEIPRDDYMALLGDSLGPSAGGLLAGVPSLAGEFGALDRLGAASLLPSGTVSAPPAGKDIVQLLTQTS